MGENLSKRLWRRATVLVAGALCVACAACDSGARARKQSDAAGSVAADSMGIRVTMTSTILVHGRPELKENSAAAMSHVQPGVFFTINDSGNEPVLFAMDTLGADRGAWRVRGSTNVDWESVSVGPCSTGRAADMRCVYIGDTGDNLSHHASRAVYRVAEPTANGALDTVRAERLSYVYLDGPHDVEAMYVARNGDIFLITKRPLFDSHGRLRSALIFRLPSAAWRAGVRAVAQVVDSLPIVPGSAPLREITDASLSEDGKHLAVRTYTHVYIFAADPLTGRVDHAVTPRLCDVTSFGEPQGEGVTWVNDSGRLLFTSEGRAVPLHIASCPLP